MVCVSDIYHSLGGLYKITGRLNEEDCACLLRTFARNGNYTLNYTPLATFEDDAQISVWAQTDFKYQANGKIALAACIIRDACSANTLHFVKTFRVAIHHIHGLNAKHLTP